MAEIELFHYRHSDKFLHRMNTTVKYICAILVTVGVFNSSLRGLLIFSLYISVISAAASFPVSFNSMKSRAGGLSRISLFLLIIIITRGLTAEGTPLEYIPILSEEGLISGGIYSWKLLILIVLGQLLISTTDPSDLQGSIYRILSKIPFLPAGTIATMISLTITFIPMIFDQYLEIRQAVDSRLGAQSHNPIRKIRTITLPLMQTTLSKADEVASAMESRCFNENPTFQKSAIKGTDILSLFISLALTISIFMANF